MFVCLFLLYLTGKKGGGGGGGNKKKFEEVYKVGRKLGEGAFAEVKEATKRGDNSGENYAIKIVTKSKLTEEDDAALKDEISVLFELGHHKHIIRLYDTFEDKLYYYLVTEFCGGGELFDRVVMKSYYNEKEARDAVKIILEALDYCHSKRVCHRDLKPENLLLQSEDDDSKLKLADFGFAKRTNENFSGLTTQCGTPGYVAPEVLEGKVYGTKADVWSIGVITYVLLGGYPPFIDQNQRKLFSKIRKGEYEFHPEYWGQVSKGAKDLIKSMLTVNPRERISCKEALENNQWLGAKKSTLAKKDLGKNLEEFKKFNAKRKFRAAVQGVVAANTVKAFIDAPTGKGSSLNARQLTKQDIADLKETFDFFDKDKGGTISMDELQLVLKKLGQKVSEKEVRRIIKSIDKNNDGELDFDEFVAMMKKIPDTENELRAAFNVFDADGSGSTSRNELKEIMRKFGQELTDAQLDAVMAEIDDDGDGEISFKEFKKAMSY